MSGVVFLPVKKGDPNVMCDWTEVGRIFSTKNKIKKKEECFVRGSGCPLASNPPPLPLIFFYISFAFFFIASGQTLIFLFALRMWLTQAWDMQDVHLLVREAPG